MNFYLGVDIGGTASRWVIVNEEGEIADRGICDGATGLIFDGAAQARFAGSLEQIRDAINGSVQFAQLGVTGAGFGRNRKIEEQISAVFGLSENEFAYSNDIVMAWRSAFPTGTGHLVSAGTGSLGMSIDPNGKMTVVGGNGIMIDDGGSGSWIALRALRKVLREVDEYGQAETTKVLASALFDAIGGEGKDSIRSYVYGGERGKIGSLAVAVARAAIEGDAYANETLEQAGSELVRLGRALLNRCGDAPLVFVGGVLALHPVIRNTIQDALGDENISFPRIEPALTAARMAREKGMALV